MKKRENHDDFDEKHENVFYYFEFSIHSIPRAKHMRLKTFAFRKNDWSKNRSKKSHVELSKFENSTFLILGKQ